MYWSQWPRGLRHRSTTARLLRSWFRIPPGACVCSALSGRGLCDELITRPEESDSSMSLCVTTKPRGRGGHSPRWAAEPEEKKLIGYIKIILKLGYMFF
jgi:hypothetical protein